MIIFTNEGNPLGLKLLLAAKFAKKDVNLKIVASLNGNIKFDRLRTSDIICETSL